MTNLHYTVLGVKRSQAASQPRAFRPRLPIIVGVLCLLRSSWEQQDPAFDGSMLWAASCTCFFGFLWSREATVPSQVAYDPAVPLSITDVSVDSSSSPSAVIIHLKSSKTDRVGVNVLLGKTGSLLCPVATLLSYISELHALFRFRDGRLLTRQALVTEVRAVLSLVGVDPAPYSGHSFRIGVATGIEDALIKILGRWRCSAYQQYIRLPQESMASVSLRLAQQ